MATEIVTVEHNGEIIEMEVPAGVSDAEIAAFLTSQASPQGGYPGAGVIEPAMAIGSSMVAEPVAGLAGLAAAPFIGPADAGGVVENVRQGLTFQPRTPAGQASMQNIGEFMAPVGEAFAGTEQALGDFAFKHTGSPALAALATAAPTAALEIIGVGLARKGAKAATGFERAPESRYAVQSALIASSPDAQRLKNAARLIYAEIDGMDVGLDPRTYKQSIDRLQLAAKSRANGINPGLSPKTTAILSNYVDSLDDIEPRYITDLENLRQQLGVVAGETIDGKVTPDARAASILLDNLDETMDSFSARSFTGLDPADAGKVMPRYKAARAAYRRYSKAETIEDLFNRAELQASGFENGLRTQIRSLLNNRRKIRQFNQAEIQAMRDVVQGDFATNTMKLIGRLGLGEGAATNIVGAGIGAAGGAALFGPSGAFASLVVGSGARRLSQKMTRRAASRMQALVNNGASGESIVRNYMLSVPPGKRSMVELSELLISAGSDLDKAQRSATRAVRDAADFTRGRLVFHSLQGGTAAGMAAPAMLNNE